MSSPSNQLPDFDELWNYDRPAESEKAFVEVLEQIEAQHEVLPAYRLELLTQIARAKVRTVARNLLICYAIYKYLKVVMHSGNGNRTEVVTGE